MDNSQTDKIGKWRKMVEFCTKPENLTDLATVPQIADTSDELQQNIDDIEEADTNATANTTGAADAKAEDRTILEPLCSQFSRSLTVYAYEQKDRVLRGKVEFPNSYFSGLRADKLLQTAKMLRKLATPLMASLAGVVAADLTNFNTAIDDFEKVIALPDELIGEKKAYGEEVDDLFIEGDKTEAKLRLYFGLLEFTKPEVFRRWDDVAHIDDTGSRSSTAKPVSDSVDANGNKVATPVTYATDLKITLANTGTTGLEFTLTIDGTPKGDPVAVAAGATVQTTLGAMGTGGDSIRVHNTSATLPGAYTITFG